MRLLFSVSLLLTTLTPLLALAADDNNNGNNSREAAYQNCVDGWIQGLTKNNPDISTIDIKYVSSYYCLCAFDIADKLTATDSTEKQKQTFKQCMPYAVLRNALHYNIETPSGKANPGPDVLNTACVNAFPIPKKDDNDKSLVANFCDCAAKPLAEVKAQKENLSEDQIKTKVTAIAKDCAGNGNDDSNSNNNNNDSDQ